MLRSPPAATIPGPGFLQVSFESTVVDVGAVVVDLQGTQFGDVEGLDGSVAVAAAATNGVTRVVASSTSPLAPRFRVAVSDLGADLPTGLAGASGRSGQSSTDRNGPDSDSDQQTALVPRPPGRLPLPAPGPRLVYAGFRTPSEPRSL